jgi:hypothetical protein
MVTSWLFGSLALARRNGGSILMNKLAFLLSILAGGRLAYGPTSADAVSNCSTRKIENATTKMKTIGFKLLNRHRPMLRGTANYTRIDILSLDTQFRYLIIE